jgi:hypothetical protein
MPTTQTAAAWRIFHLPTKVEETALASVICALEETPPANSVQCVLDFSASSHVRFQDFQKFTQFFRERLRLSHPILLAGLNPYCEEILRFALRAEDWELFCRLEPVAPAGTTWGNVGRPALASRGREAQWCEGVRNLPAPSVN